MASTGPAPTPFSMVDPNLKFTRAREHFETLNREIDEFVKADAYDMSQELDSESGWYVCRFYALKEPPPRLGLIAGDFANNLRASLDHVVYEIAGRKGRTQFPIFLSEAEYRDKRGANPSHRDQMLAGVSNELRAVIDGAQPYHRGDTANGHPLAVLKRFTDFDKHRVVHPAIARPEHMTLHPRSPGVGSLEYQIANIKGPVEEGAELCRYRIVEVSDPDVKVEVEFTFSIAFSDFLITTPVLQDVFNYTADLLAEFAQRLEFAH